MPRGESVATTAVKVPSLLESKLAPPVGRDGLLVRPRLISALDDTSSRKLTLVSAPCGYGKTSLLATWSAQTTEPVAWLTLDQNDGDPGRFWSYVASAVERARPGAGRRALSLLSARGGAPDLGLNELLSDLEAAPLAIVLDDLHTVTGAEQCFELLGYAVEHLPSGVRIVIGTRSDPALPLGRLRALGLLGEVRAHDLAFTTEEARQLLVEREELDLGTAEIELLVERTEGWPVCLYLSGLWLRDQTAQRTQVRQLVAGHRWLSEYLTDEIMTTLDPQTRDLLMQGSVLTRLSGSLCDKVLARDDSHRILRDVSRANLLVAPLDPDGQWFRVHRLFREMLKLELDRERPGIAPELHRRAAAWYRRHGYVEDAVEHALLAGAEEEAASILSSSWRAMLRRGDGATLLSLAERLSTDVMLEHPDLAAGSALSTIGARRPLYERSRWLAVAEGARAVSSQKFPAVERAVSLTHALALDGDVGFAVEHARTAVEAKGDGDLGNDVLASAALAYALYLAGGRDEARTVASTAIALPGTPDRPHALIRALGTLALLAVDAGRADEAEARVREAIKLALERGLETGASMHIAHLARARVLKTKGHLRAAEAAAELGECLSRLPDPSVPHAHSLLVLGDVRARRGRVGAATQVLAAAEREIMTFRDAGILPKLAARVRGRIRAAKAGLAVEHEPLSAAEMAVLRLLGTDLSRQGIARRLFLSVNTIKTHSRSIYRKLGVTSRAEAVARAHALGLVEAAGSPG